jgi:SHS2 domain-containing protein
MNQFTFHSHTADVQMKVRADTLYALFETALLGMSHLMKNNFCNTLAEGNQEIRLSVQSVDITALLIDFLSEVLLNSHIHKTIYCTLTIDTLTEKALSGVLSGRQIGSFDEDIKAVTYHEAQVIQNSKSEWEASIIFDI